MITQDFAVTALDGKTRRLSDFHGKVVFLTLFSVAAASTGAPGPREATR